MIMRTVNKCGLVPMDRYLVKGIPDSAVLCRAATNVGIY